MKNTAQYETENSLNILVRTMKLIKLAILTNMKITSEIDRHPYGKWINQITNTNLEEIL